MELTCESIGMSKETAIQENYFNAMRDMKNISHSPKYKDLVDLFWEVIGEAKVQNLFPETTTIDFYLKNSEKVIAACHYHYYTKPHVLDLGFSFNENIARKIPPERLIKVVVHEVAHACTIGDHHGKRWQECAEKIGAKWGFTDFGPYEDDEVINTVMKEDKLAHAKFKVTCPACGAVQLFAEDSEKIKKFQNLKCVCGWKDLQLTEL